MIFPNLVYDILYRLYHAQILHLPALCIYKHKHRCHFHSQWLSLQDVCWVHFFHVGSIHPRCLPGQEGSCAVGWLSATSGAHSWSNWSSPFSFSVVLVVHSGNIILATSIIKFSITVLTQKSSSLGVHIVFPFSSALLTKYIQVSEQKQSHSQICLCLMQDYSKLSSLTPFSCAPQRLHPLLVCGGSDHAGPARLVELPVLTEQVAFTKCRSKGLKVPPPTDFNVIFNSPLYCSVFPEAGAGWGVWCTHSVLSGQMPTKLFLKLIPLADSILSRVLCCCRTCFSSSMVVIQALVWGTGYASRAHFWRSHTILFANILSLYQGPIVVQGWISRSLKQKRPSKGSPCPPTFHTTHDFPPLGQISERCSSKYCSFWIGLDSS